MKELQEVHFCLTISRVDLDKCDIPAIQDLPVSEEEHGIVFLSTDQSDKDWRDEQGLLAVKNIPCYGYIERGKGQFNGKFFAVYAGTCYNVVAMNDQIVAPLDEKGFVAAGVQAEVISYHDALTKAKKYLADVESSMRPKPKPAGSLPCDFELPYQIVLHCPRCGRSTYSNSFDDRAKAMTYAACVAQPPPMCAPCESVRDRETAKKKTSPKKKAEK